MNHPHLFVYDRSSSIDPQATGEPVTVFIFDFTDKTPDKVYSTCDCTDCDDNMYINIRSS